MRDYTNVVPYTPKIFPKLLISLRFVVPYDKDGLKLTALVPMQPAQCSEAEMTSVTEPAIHEEICLEMSITSKSWNLL